MAAIIKVQFHLSWDVNQIATGTGLLTVIPEIPWISRLLLVPMYHSIPFCCDWKPRICTAFRLKLSFLQAVVHQSKSIHTAYAIQASNVNTTHISFVTKHIRAHALNNHFKLKTGFFFFHIHSYRNLKKYTLTSTNSYWFGSIEAVNVEYSVCVRVLMGACL